ncbi:glycosyltransferase [Maritalea mediterranea]|uniref:Glycosyltransferase family 2 protein n=1 Tax=Maritalea mediterranea TaxID=2909667 RepID=A0ABS9E4G9_9HYPH|nr:glycosyltransferase family 2 protein [Maritalea mediterranea]MCF4097761.1 glycosyltransferase family 2 protein [Maritalea mediterranea]
MSVQVESSQMAAGWSAPKLTIVVPTFNERGNIELLVEKLEAVFPTTPFEIIFVDDNSPDGTAELAKDIGKKKPWVKCIKRIGRRGLSSACVEGISASNAPFVAVMDADHQHDETVLPQMLAMVEADKDLVLASRFLDGRSAGDGLTKFRETASNVANWIANLVTGTKITDPMTGFFMLKREKFEQVAPKLSDEGFKILLDIIATARNMGKPLQIGEVGFTFRARHDGESKMSPLIAVQFFGLALSKMTGGYLPSSFFLFAAVGGIGVFVHLLALTLASGWLGFNFTNAQLFATIVAMTSNFHHNNMFTYADRQLRGLNYWKGLLSFYAVCAIPAIANVSVAAFIFEQNSLFYLAAIAGIIISIVFNYAMTRIFTWRA